MILRTALSTTDPYFGWTPIWNFAGPPTSVTLTGADGSQYRFNNFDPFRANTCTWRALGYSLPADIPTGIYQSTLGFDFSVTADAPSDVVTIDAPGSANLVEAALRAGMSIRLGPGLHVWKSAVNLYGVNRPQIEGFNAVVIRLPNGDYGERMFAGGEGLSVRGVEFRPWYVVLHANPNVYNVSFVDCRFVGSAPATLGWGALSVHVERCEFVGVDSEHFGMYVRNVFSGPNAGISIYGPCAGKVALVDNEFTNTSRGPVINTDHGPVTDCLFAGNRVSGLRDDNNGNEAFLVEGSHSFDNNIVIHHRVWDSDGFAISLWDAPASGNAIIDLVQEGGQGILLADATDTEQSNNTFDTWELRDTGGITLGWTDGNGVSHGRGIYGNVFQNGLIVGFRPSCMGNQGNFDPARLRNVVASGNWRTNKLDARFVNLPAGVIPQTVEVS